MSLRAEYKTELPSPDIDPLLKIKSIDLENLDKTCRSITHQGARLKAEHFLTLFKSKLAEQAEQKYTSYEEILNFESLITSTRKSVATMACDSNSSLRANTIFRVLETEVLKHKKLLFPEPVIIPKDIPHWTEVSLRLQVDFILKHPNITATLAKIHKLGHKDARIPGMIYMCYSSKHPKAKNSETLDAEYLTWVKPFLRDFYKLLNMAGLLNVHLDIINEPAGGFIYRYPEQIMIEDTFVLLFGTESLKTDMTPRLSTELGNINSKISATKDGESRVIPILISGKNNTSLPTNIISDLACLDWIKPGVGFFSDFCRLIGQFYGNKALFQPVWDELLNLRNNLLTEEDKIILTKGLSEEDVRIALEAEKKIAADDRAARGKAARALLGLSDAIVAPSVPVSQGSATSPVTIPIAPTVLPSLSLSAPAIVSVLPVSIASAPPGGPSLPRLTSGMWAAPRSLEATPDAVITPRPGV